MIIMARVELSK